MFFNAAKRAKNAFQARWSQKQIWVNLCVQVGEYVIELQERFGKPHLLVYDQDDQKLSDFLSSFISSAALEYSPDDISFFVMDGLDGRLRQLAQQFPHYVGGIHHEKEWNLGMHLLHHEILKRENLLKENQINSANAYARAYYQGTVEKPMPALFVIVHGGGHYSADTEDQYGELVHMAHLARSLNVHLIFALNESGWSDRIEYMFGREIPLSSAKGSSKEWLAEVDHTVSLYRKFSEPLNLTQKLLIDEHRWRWDVSTEEGVTKSLELIHGDLCSFQPESDVVVCSAFKNDYIPTSTSLIGALLREKGIDVDSLSQDPELDFRSVGCWLSRDTGTEYRRIACVELLGFREFSQNSDQAVNTLIKKSFATLRFILEQANIAELPVKTIALPVLGTGDQNIDLSYISGPLISQCCSILRENQGVEKIVIYEKTLEKVNALASIISTALTEQKTFPKVFISYSSKQEAIAREICETIEKNRISCWMAPESIPAGSSYQSIIPVALHQVDVILLILTPDAERSRWVQKEIGSAIGANKKLLPYQLNQFALSTEFSFLLDGEQIMYHDAPVDVVIPGAAMDEKYARLLMRLKELLAKG